MRRVRTATRTGPLGRQLRRRSFEFAHGQSFQEVPAPGVRPGTASRTAFERRNSSRTAKQPYPYVRNMSVLGGLRDEAAEVRDLPVALVGLLGKRLLTPSEN